MKVLNIGPLKAARKSGTKRWAKAGFQLAYIANAPHVHEIKKVIKKNCNDLYVYAGTIDTPLFVLSMIIPLNEFLSN
jgi:hypothetical protein